MFSIPPLIAIPPVSASDRRLFQQTTKRMEVVTNCRTILILLRSRTIIFLRNKTESCRFYTTSDRAQWSQNNDGAEEPGALFCNF
jgi:hypothetical protein